MWRVLFPRDGATVRLFGNKFVASGTAPPGLDDTAIFVKLIRTSAGPAWERHGTLVHNAERGGRRRWVAFFDLTQGGWDPRAEYEVVIFHTPGNGNEDDKDRVALRLSATLDETREAAKAAPAGFLGVSLIYPPNGSTMSAAGFSAYGQLTAPATSVANDGGRLTGGTNPRSSAGGTMGGGFWWVTFDAVAAGTYSLAVVANDGSSSTPVTITTA
ncbi:MAG: hypothetical protein U0804_16840 [Gemmataceae bacterium]